eukprot:TRINITY_DN18167_c0_g1_i2.p2 TRINITY_DN18167_c0_g1~~TRINITY_DN18167_c0_g1_i2.p2  ORF type:complete len:184 (+),score=51.39 TRINITY_DN18167_c0_g1_i2:145-696(+)
MRAAVRASMVALLRPYAVSGGATLLRKRLLGHQVAACRFFASGTGAGEADRSVIYEVNLKFRDKAAGPSIVGCVSWYAEFTDWLRSQHIGDVLQSEGFVSAEMFDLPKEVGASSDVASAPPDVTVHYRVQRYEDLERYFEERAPQMRQDGIDRFAGRFEASRRILWSSHRCGGTRCPDAANAE